MIIIELTGPPCSGKTTIIDEIRQDPRIITYTKSWLIKQITAPWIPRAITFFYSEAHLLTLGLFTLKASKVSALIQAISKSRWPVSRKLNVFRNVCHKYAIHAIANRLPEDKILLLDEGISHISFIFATSTIKCPKGIRRFYPFENTIILKLSASSNTLSERLETRGHPMLDESISVENFVKMNKKASKSQDKDFKKLPNVDVLRSLDETLSLASTHVDNPNPSKRAHE